MGNCCGGGDERPTVCVTGATGYLGQHVVKLLLQRGYVVNATTRPTTREKCPDKIACLESLPRAKEEVNGRARLRIFDADLNKEGSFEEAIRGSECVFHTASPFYMADTSYDELVRTATAGTDTVLRTANEVGVRKIVLTSSTAAVYAWYGNRDLTADLTEPITEEDWSNEPELRAREAWYPLSKTLAEKGAWKLAEELGLQLTVMNPCLIFGPILSRTQVTGQDGQQRAQVNTSVENILKLLDGSSTEIKCNNKCIVDVRDVALAHVQGFELGTWGKRHPLIADCPTWEEVTGVVRSTLEEMDLKEQAAVKVPGLVSEISPTQPFMGALYPDKTTVSPTIAARLQINYRTTNQMVADTVKSLHKFYPECFNKEVHPIGHSEDSRQASHREIPVADRI